MKYLIDTHVLIWHFNGSPTLPENVIDIMGSGNLYISAISLWEIAIKMNLGRLDLLISLEDLLSAVARSEITVCKSRTVFLKGFPRCRLCTKTRLTACLFQPRWFWG